MPGTAATDLFLKQSKVDEIVQGNEYVICTDKQVLWRKFRSVKSNPDVWRLVAYDRMTYPDIIVNKADIRDAWRVITRMTILVS